MTQAMRQRAAALVAILVLLAAACGSADNADSAGLTVVVTTNILGDVVQNLVGDDVEVVVIMPVGSDPHDFQASAQQVAQIGEAGALIVNGAGFEEGLLDVIESAEEDGVPTFEAISAVSTLEFGDHDDEDHDDEDHDDEDHDDEDHDDEDHDEHEHKHEHEGVDPHFFTDPLRIADAAAAISDFLGETVTGIDDAALTANTEAYLAELRALDVEISEEMAALPRDRRILVTNHEVYGYFADRYGFEIVGTVIPSGTTVDTASAQALAALAQVVEDEQVPAIFADTSSSHELAQTLADEVGSIAVVELFSESLGPSDSAGATYVQMIRTNATRIIDALTS